MYNETDYLTADVLNYIESRVRKLDDLYSEYTNIDYISKLWSSNEFVFVDDIANIENYIEKLGYYFDYPSSWEISRDWNLDGDNNINYKDLNRWLKNIDALLNYKVNPLVPSETLYPAGNYLYPNTSTYPDANLYSLKGNMLLPSNKKEE